jgi:uncharacterized membrane protein YkoI
MRLRLSPKAFYHLLLVGLVCTVLPVTEVQAKPQKEQHQTRESKNPKQEQHALTAAEAAARARDRHGGKVLKVSPQGKGYRVKLLTDSGRVITVTIKD